MLSCWPLLLNLPDGTFFETNGTTLEFHGKTLDDVHAITRSFPGSIWRKHWKSWPSWWEYTTTYQGIKMRIYAVQEAPQTCTAITAIRTVEKEVPVAYETQQVEEQVIVGWDCGGGGGPAA